MSRVPDLCAEAARVGSLDQKGVGQRHPSAADFTPIDLRTDLNKRLYLARVYSDNGQVSGYYLNRTYNYGAQNNGTVLSITNNKDANRTQNFTYDPLGRITAGWTNASTGTDSWGETYSIDAWGNVKVAPLAGKASGGNFQCAADGSNRVGCLSYDAAGNVTANGPVGYGYDQENRLTSTGGMSYTYNAEGERLEKTGGSSSMLYWYGMPGVMAESDLAGNIKHEYVFFNGKRVARVDSPGNTVHYYLSDHLNSTAMVVSSTGAIEEESDYSPYGTEYVITGPGANHYKFNGKERDLESGLDDFGARYYASKLARWMSPDWSASPEPVPYAKMGNPQSLNLYSFVTNNPLSNTDLDGHARHQIGGMSADYKCDMGMTTFCQEAAEQQQQQQQQQSQSPPQNRNPVVQVVRDTAVGGAKEVANTFIDAANTVNAPIDAVLSNFTSFRFGQGTDFQASTPGEQSAMAGIFIVSFFDGAGEEKTASKIPTLTADAEKLYPKLVGKSHDHHIIPKYLGGAKDGETAHLSAAYHQLITNEFRRIAPYGQKIERSAEEVGRILQQVYSKYPLPLP